MNLKHLFPTYRRRYRFVQEVLDGVTDARALHVGCGEGDYDLMIAEHSAELESCDINEEDVTFARAANADHTNIRYSVQDGHSLSFSAATFGLVVCIEVVEHVLDPRRLIFELARVSRPGATVIVTCPNDAYPLVYDPMNAVLRRVGARLPFGAYGYGHSHLMRADELEGWFAEAGLQIVDRQGLTGAVAASAEVYWPSLFQRLLKANSANRTARTRRTFVIKPGRGVPALVAVTDWLVDVDRKRAAARSVGLGYVLRKKA